MLFHVKRVQTHLLFCNRPKLQNYHPVDSLFQLCHMRERSLILHRILDAQFNKMGALDAQNEWPCLDWVQVFIIAPVGQRSPRLFFVFTYLISHKFKESSLVHAVLTVVAVFGSYQLAVLSFVDFFVETNFQELVELLQLQSVIDRDPVKFSE